VTVAHELKWLVDPDSHKVERCEIDPGMTTEKYANVRTHNSDWRDVQRYLIFESMEAADYYRSKLTT
jgi:hypothetical protein